MRMTMTIRRRPHHSRRSGRGIIVAAEKSRKVGNYADGVFVSGLIMQAARQHRQADSLSFISLERSAGLFGFFMIFMVADAPGSGLLVSASIAAYMLR